MHIVLTGATGFIGTATLEALQAAGHTVTAAVRSEASAATVEAAGASAVVGDITDTKWMSAQLAEVDGAVHLAAGDDSQAMDDAVLDAVIASFAGSQKPYVHTGGIWVWGDNADITEESPLAPPALTAWRLPREERLLASGLRASVIAPGIVYGRGQGIPRIIADAPRDDDGALVLVGSGAQHWATVHVDDLAELYVAVLEKAPGGATYIGASGVSPMVRELGLAVVGDGGDVVDEPVEASRARLGAGFADALLLDQQASGALAKQQFSWNPSRPTLVEELAAGYGARPGAGG